MKKYPGIFSAIVLAAIAAVGCAQSSDMQSVRPRLDQSFAGSTKWAAESSRPQRSWETYSSSVLVPATSTLLTKLRGRQHLRDEIHVSRDQSKLNT